jgi:hypothetical protein
MEMAVFWVEEHIISRFCPSVFRVFQQRSSCHLYELFCLPYRNQKTVERILIKFVIEVSPLEDSLN